jgi:hypothetical protein
MKTLSRLIMVSCMGALLGFVLSAPADARGPSNVRLAEHGWLCLSTGPHSWVHCFPPSTSLGEDVGVAVLVFDSTDAGVDGNPLGTELLIHEDIFHGQPCPQDAGGEYEPVEGLPYLACHHFATEE